MYTLTGKQEILASIILATQLPSTKFLSIYVLYITSKKVLTNIGIQIENTALRGRPVPKCPACGTLFKKKYPNQRYCTPTCRPPVQRHRTLKKVCGVCEKVFTTNNRAQVYCSAKCNHAAESDQKYFGGLRSTAVGFKERKCWVCGKIGVRRMNVHHVVGRQNSHQPLVALCAGCHQLVTYLGNRVFLEDAHKVADLITLARFQKGLEDKRTILNYE